MSTERGECRLAARRLRIQVRPPDVRQVADGPPPGNFHDHTRCEKGLASLYHTFNSSRRHSDVTQTLTHPCSCSTHGSTSLPQLGLCGPQPGFAISADTPSPSTTYHDGAQSLPLIMHSRPLIMHSRRLAH
jgi:hypothetical protein